MLQVLQVDRQTKLQTLYSGRLLYSGVEPFPVFLGAASEMFFAGVATAALDVIPGWA